MNAQAITITGCTILPMTGAGAVIESGYVSVLDGVITAVGAGEPPAGGRGGGRGHRRPG